MYIYIYYICIYIYVYNIYIYIFHHWRILRSSYRMLASVGFEPMTTEFRSDGLTDWAIRPWVQLALRANFEQLLQFHRLFSVKIHFSYCFRQSPRLFYSKFPWGNHMSVADKIVVQLSTYFKNLLPNLKVHSALPRIFWKPVSIKLVSI